MLKLIRLEWKKNNIIKYIWIVFIMTIFLLLLIFAASGELEADETVQLYGKSMLDSSISLFTHMSFIIFASTMLSSFIVSPYKNKTINLMFSYPINRKKILLSQILAVWIFNFISLVLSKLLIYYVLMFTRQYTNITMKSFALGSLDFYMELFISSAVMISISFIALLIGLITKSAKSAIITGVIIAAFTQGNIGPYTLINNLSFYCVLLLLSFIAVFLSIFKIETKDVL